MSTRRSGTIGAYVRVGEKVVDLGADTRVGWRGASGTSGSGLDRVCTLEPMNEPLRELDDLDVDNAAFWLERDLADLIVSVKPYEDSKEFAIDDLTDDEWDRFVSALNE